MGGIHLSEELLAGLNPVQQTIVRDTEGNKLILAGAGSGKTRVLTHRIAYLMTQNVPPWQILAVTFTNKAAREMRERVVQLAGTEAREVWMGTFHSVCIRMLARFGSEIGIDKFTIIDDTDQKKLIKEVIALMDSNFEVDVIKKVISDAKNELVTPEMLLEVAKNGNEQALAHMYEAYEEKKTENNYLDYDDCISKAVLLFENSQAARDHYQHQFRYVMTDESQDTNRAQFKLLMHLSAHHENLFAVADVDQSIYKFRGAEMENIINFNTFFPETKLYKLEQNYRSTDAIVQASNAVILNNKERLDKTAFTDKELGDLITVYQADDDTREADFVARTIQHVRRRKDASWNDFAVLYRTNRQSREIEKAFTQFGIPYEIVNGHAFYDRKEIKDIVGYLRAVNNEMDVLAFNRIINVPKRGIGAKTIERIQDYAIDCNIPFSKALENVTDVPKIPKKALASIQDFLEMMNEFKTYSDSDGSSIAELLQLILQRTGYKIELNPDRDDDLSRIENLEELVNVAAKWDMEEHNEEGGGGLTQFLTETSLTSAVDGMEDKDTVTLLTIHSSKGLEFPNVFIVGMEENVFPHSRSNSDPKEMEEERRLIYVALTRAEEKLFLTHCKQRFDYGGGLKYNQPSRFLREIPKHLIKRI